MMTDPGQAGQPGERQPLAVPQPAAPPQQQHASGSKARRQRLQVLLLGGVSVVTLLVSTGAWAVTSYVSGKLGRVDAGTTGTPDTGPVNIVVAGIDSRDGLTHRQEVELHVG